MRMKYHIQSGKIKMKEERIMKKCPFNFDVCTQECALFIAPTDINDLVASRLTSIGVYDKQNGMCSLKNHALAKSREIFEKSQANKF